MSKGADCYHCPKYRLLIEKLFDDCRILDATLGEKEKEIITLKEQIEELKCDSSRMTPSQIENAIDAEHKLNERLLVENDELTSAVVELRDGLRRKKNFWFPSTHEINSEIESICQKYDHIGRNG